ncbi:unnamed protein product [Durusdinium trenchii]|uniref:EF-hand domain-containing protein n=1 Tax=Durusdinium trenchii TaxID=1381693 RepID=A0ABP0IYM4_9DINO
MIGGVCAGREEGRVHGEFSLVDLHYQLRDLQDFVEARFKEQVELLKPLLKGKCTSPASRDEPEPHGHATRVSIEEDDPPSDPPYVSPILQSPRISPRLKESIQVERTRDSAQSRQSKQSYGSMTSEQRTSLPSNLSAASDHGSLASLASAMWDETGMRFREKARKQAVRLRESRLSPGRAPSRVEKYADRVNQIVTSPLFTNSIMLLIMINVILLGVEVDLSAGVGISDVPSWLSWANAAFVGIFCIELLLRYAAVGRRAFWCGEDSSWNVFDFVVITVSVADVALDYMAVWLSPSVNAGQLRLVRSIRLARALRGIRIVWLFEYVGALRTLALSIISTSGSLFWTLVILVILVYSFGVVVTQLVVEHCRGLAAEAQQDPNAIPNCAESPGLDGLDRYWSSVPGSMLTLFASISGGLDWESALQPLFKVSSWAVGLVILYIAVTVFAVLNVVIGVFCNTAIENASVDKELASIKQVYTKSNQVHTLQKIFYEIDATGTNEVSIEDLEDAMTRGELSSFLESMGISTDDVWTLCILLDTDQSGTIDLEEFVSGCIQLHGPAKSMQLAKMSYENRVTRRALKQVQQDVHLVKTLLTTTHPSAPNLTNEAF